MKKLLLCPPKHYDIRYEINPWMSTDNPIDPDKVAEEYRTLTYAYRQFGISYDELTPDPELPDQVYTTDLGHAEGNLFIKANFKYPERQKEATIAEAYFKTNGFDVFSFPDNVYFEGGDFLKVGDRYYYGFGKRSSKEAMEPIQKALGKPIISIELPDEFFYHLDTCFSPLSEDVALLNRDALTQEGVSEIEKHFKTVIDVKGEDNKLLACNLISHEGTVIMSQGVSNELKDQIIAQGFRVATVSVGEYLKGGGGIHCVSLEMW